MQYTIQSFCAFFLIITSIAAAQENEFIEEEAKN